MAEHRFRGKVAVITGASSGIGRATTLALAREGANLALAARHADTLQQVQRDAEALGVEALAIPTDVADQEQVRQLAKRALVHFGQIDLLVASAGAYLRRPVRELTVEDVEWMMRVNFFGCLYAILNVLPHMLERRTGHIVAVSSLDGKKGIPPDGAYVASKFAIAGLTDVLRQELRGTGVYLTTVFPGRVDTPMIAGLGLPPITPKIPPEVVARAIVRAIERRQPEVVIPSAGGRLLILTSAISPRLSDWAVRVLRLGGWDEAPRHARLPTT